MSVVNPTAQFGPEPTNGIAGSIGTSPTKDDNTFGTAQLGTCPHLQTHALLIPQRAYALLPPMACPIVGASNVTQGTALRQRSW